MAVPSTHIEVLKKKEVCSYLRAAIISPSLLVGPNREILTRTVFMHNSDTCEILALEKSIKHVPQDFKRYLRCMGGVPEV